MKSLALLFATLALAGCQIQRAVIAQDARTSMIGMTKEQALSCMGPPVNKAVEGATEVWSYPPPVGTMPGERYCTVNLTMTAGRISTVDYLGPSGGLLSAGEQCAFAIQNCVKH